MTFRHLLNGMIFDYVLNASFIWIFATVPIQYSANPTLFWSMKVIFKSESYAFSIQRYHFAFCFHRKHANPHSDTIFIRQQPTSPENSCSIYQLYSSFHYPHPFTFSYHFVFVHDQYQIKLCFIHSFRFHIGVTYLNWSWR